MYQIPKTPELLEENSVRFRRGLAEKDSESTGHRLESRYWGLCAISNCTAREILRGVQRMSQNKRKCKPYI